MDSKKFTETLVGKVRESVISQDNGKKELGFAIHIKLGVAFETARTYASSLNSGDVNNFNPYEGSTGASRRKRLDRLGILLGILGVDEKDSFIEEIKRDYPNFEYRR